MDLSTDMSPTPFRSFDLNEEPSASINNQRKRKLQFEYENTILPLPKCKFRDRFQDCDDDDSSIEEVIDGDEPKAFQSSNGWKDCSFMGSNKSDGLQDDDMTVDTCSRVTAASLECASHYDQPSTSSGSCSNSNIFNNSPYSVNRNSLKKKKSVVMRDKFEHEEAEDESDYDDEFAQYKDELYEFEAFSNLLSSEIESNVLNKCINACVDGCVLCPSGLTSDSLARSLDSKPEVQKPTIDREFEQYFSSLML